MNGLALRINRSGSKKTKNSIGYSPVNITTPLKDAGENNELFNNFAEAATTDEQLAIMKQILDQCNQNVNSEVVKFMVLVFLQADSKHPVKCFISRHVTKNNFLQLPFTDALALHITTLTSSVPSHYKQYVEVVSKVATCIENFNAGAAAVRLVETNLGAYLKSCLELCVKILRESKNLSPTEKNEIFTLAHLTLRLLLHIVQKANEYSYYKLALMFNAIWSCIQDLMFDDDVPMDTKSVCGILYLTMHITENGPNSWIDVLNPKSSDITMLTLLTGEASQLCLYSALTTLVSVEKLETDMLDDVPVIFILLDKILDIGDRSSSDSTFILCVTRTLLQISKMLHQLTFSVIGLSIVESLLMFAWAHLEHYMDSVRHLTAQILATVVSYCAMLDRDGDESALGKLLTALKSLDTSRKSYYVSVTCLVAELGCARVWQTWPALVPDVLAALSSQHIQASATIALETLLQKHAKSCSTQELHCMWVRSILSHVERHTLDSAVLNILENLLVTAVKLHKQLMDYIIPYIKQSCALSSHRPRDLKCILMLLSVVRKSGGTNQLSDSNSDFEWKGIISYDVLKQAAIDAVDETRILSLSLIVESPKSTEEFTAGDLSFVLFYLRYNINAQAPNFRQLTLSVMKKFTKRLEDSYKVIKRQKDPKIVQHKVEYYLRFFDDLRQQCFDSLLPGANYSRRYVALQLLVWSDRMQLEGYDRTWKPEYVEKLLLHLEDSYENNKTFASEVLSNCPVDVVKSKKYSISIDIEDILAQASCLKPTECVSAAYKLDYLRQKFPDDILQGEQCSVAEPVTYTLVSKLLRRLRQQLLVCARSVARAARQAPLYGLLHCVTHVLGNVDPGSIASDGLWTSLISDIITTCMEVNASVACVVNNSSPEGHLPMDMSGVVVTDDGNTGGILLDDGRQVTAQMVLLCAWRSVKEVSLLLGLISSRLHISGEESTVGTLTSEQMSLMGEHFTTLLAETKHRGAFEQAYVGFTKLLSRLWRCRSASLHSLPQTWLADLTRIIASGEKKGSLCATRRSAGLPFMIQALVTTEVQVQGNPKCLHACLAALLRASGGACVTSRGHASGGACVTSRGHALNVLRALLRARALEDGAAPFVGDGLVAALRGFDGDTWAERNSSTLLFSALMVRVFGVQRSKDADRLCVRNRMTGRIFFLRYPQLYDFMLDKLQEVSSNKDTQVLRPSLYPVLLLLARLYPSSLEGTVSNLKLVAFIPHVLSCAKSGVLKTRQLAAKAMVPLISPEQYVLHVHSMFSLLTPSIPRNFCHGILLQLSRLLDDPPEQLDELEHLQGCIENTIWVLQQAVGERPCYLIADEYVKVLNLVVWRFPTLLQDKIISKIILYLDKLIFNSPAPRITSGRDVCLANAIYLHFIVLNKDIKNTCELIYKGLQHTSYEIVLSTLNYLLILHDSLDEISNKFQEHLCCISNKTILYTFKRNHYIQLLCQVLKGDYLECQQKSLKILTLEGDTQKFIIEAKIEREVPEELILDKLFECVQDAHEKLTHVYLESLLNYVTNKLKKGFISAKVMLEVIRLTFEYSSADNDEDTRNAVVKFIERNIEQLLNFDDTGLSEEEKFELKSTTWCTIITLLEDDELPLRQRIADAVTSQGRVTSRLLPAAAVTSQGRVTSRLLPAAAVTSQGRVTSRLLPAAAVTSQGRVTSRLLPAAAAERLRAAAAGRGGPATAALFVLLALLDFKSVVVSDEGNDECRVFDQNEKYNIFLEETVWTNACADKIIDCCKNSDIQPIDYVCNIIDNAAYKPVIVKLCNENVVLFNKMIKGETLLRNDALNPKIELFFNRLRN